MDRRSSVALPHRVRPVPRPAPRLLVGMLVIAMLFAAWPGTVRAQADFDELVVFGTSLSDPGNAFALVGGTNTPPDYFVDPLLLPDRPYVKGGHHFSNGPTWIEQLARPFAFAANAQPAFRSLGSRAMNFAVGGARARAVPGNVHLAAQVAAYLLKSGGVASPDTLYVIEMGSTDVRDALAAALSGGNPVPIRQQAVGTIAGTVAALYGLGARKFLIWSAPDLGLTPAALRQDQLQPGAAALATLQAVEFNNALDAELQGLEAVLAGLQIQRLDVFDLVHQVVADPAAFNFADVDSACLTPSVPPFTCQNPDVFLFWDGTHPTRAGHAMLATEARKILGL